MFGQEPRLPVDFLLGRVQNPVGGYVHEWVQEHQARLQMAFEGARDRLKAAAERRKKNHDQHVRDVPLEEGQLVWLRDLGVRGRHKIQDQWASVKYCVMRAPREGGSVYTIAPRDDPTRARQVHRSLLKAVVGLDSPGGAAVSSPPPPEQSQSEDEVSGDGDWLVERPENPLPASFQAEAVTQTTPRLLVPPSDPAPSVPSSLIVPAPVVASTSSLPVARNAVRRTIRLTAGHHPNVHHLQRSAGGAGQGSVNPSVPISNAVAALFRPWR